MALKQYDWVQNSKGRRGRIVQLMDYGANPGAMVCWDDTGETRSVEQRLLTKVQPDCP